MDESYQIDETTGKVVKRRDDKMAKTIATIEIGFAVTTREFEGINWDFIYFDIKKLFLIWLNVSN